MASTLTMKGKHHLSFYIELRRTNKVKLSGTPTELDEGCGIGSVCPYLSHPDTHVSLRYAYQTTIKATSPQGEKFKFGQANLVEGEIRRGTRISIRRGDSELIDEVIGLLDRGQRRSNGTIYFPNFQVSERANN
ncbi:hypothetical protein RUM43_000322 [Polyplax serrata]|uniref:Uncharacterized protein n=1 Tax=Polyplax serrata TaxID=468196 RepID=A0AAN8SCM8_POLSC